MDLTNELWEASDKVLEIYSKIKDSNKADKSETMWAVQQLVWNVADQLANLALLTQTFPF